MKIFAANWKLNKNPQQTRDYFSSLRQKASALSQIQAELQLVFFPPATNLEATSESVLSFEWPKPVCFGAQNCYFEAQGAFTGEVSAQTLLDLKGSHVLLGHSERRTLFIEKDQMIAKKIGHVQKLGLTPMLCIGETLSERDAGQVEETLVRQLTLGLEHAKNDGPVVIAYEPVWAIGTGRVAEPQQVVEAHAIIRNKLLNLGFKACSILYGGSVKPDNAKSLIRLPEVDGFLIGGASLEVNSMLNIVTESLS
jgi:triosephosphate isomerase